MKIQLLSTVKIRGRKTGLYNYKYVTDDGAAISATFQATKRELENMALVNTEAKLLPRYTLNLTPPHTKSP